MRAIQGVENEAERSAEQQEHGGRQNGGEAADRGDPDVFEALPHRICPSSHARNSSAGSTVETSRTEAIGRSLGVSSGSVGSRTASFSVVNTMAARAFTAAAATRPTSGLVK